VGLGTTLGSLRGQRSRATHPTMRRRWIGLTLVCAACVHPRQERPAPGGPYDVAVAGGATAIELAQGKTERTVLGWQLAVRGDRAKYFACSAEDACTADPVEIPAKTLLGVKVIGRARPVHPDGTSGDEVDVLRLTVSREPAGTSRGGMSSDGRGLIVR
jgi:hypothetical protein